MRILNPDVQRHLDAGTGLRLNLGSGEKPRPGFFNVDCVPDTNPDILADLNDPLSELPDDSVAEVYTRHTLEHVSRFMELIAELYRVSRPDCRIEIVVPHFSNPYGYSDPTHVRFFGLYSFFYFCSPADQPRRKVPSFYTPIRFRVESVRFRLPRKSLGEKLARAVLEAWINRDVKWLDWYERRLCRLLPVNDVQYVLQPVKPAARAASRAA